MGKEKALTVRLEIKWVELKPEQEEAFMSTVRYFARVAFSQPLTVPTERQEATEGIEEVEEVKEEK
jgi:hypothetical protein